MVTVLIIDLLLVAFPFPISILHFPTTIFLDALRNTLFTCKFWSQGLLLREPKLRHCFSGYLVVGIKLSDVPTLQPNAKGWYPSLCGEGNNRGPPITVFQRCCLVGRGSLALNIFLDDCNENIIPEIFFLNLDLFCYFNFI